MTNEETVKDIDTAIMLEGACECSCDPEVGWVCERCFVISTLESAKRLLTQRALDFACTCFKNSNGTIERPDSKCPEHGTQSQ